MSEDTPADIEFPNNVIERKFGACGHYGRLLYDSKSESLTCADCEKPIPLHIGIERFISVESELQRNWARAKLIRQEIADKSKCKCEHCGRFTRIRFNITDSNILDLVHETKKGKKR